MGLVSYICLPVGERDREGEHVYSPQTAKILHLLH